MTNVDAVSRRPLCRARRVMRTSVLTLAYLWAQGGFHERKTSLRAISGAQDGVPRRSILVLDPASSTPIDVSSFKRAWYQFLNQRKLPWWIARAIVWTHHSFVHNPCPPHGMKMLCHHSAREQRPSTWSLRMQSTHATCFRTSRIYCTPLD